MQLYKTFGQLLKTWHANESSALVYGNDRKTVTYSVLARAVRDAEKEIRRSKLRSELIVTDHEPETIIRIFACVLAGTDVVLIDESTPDEAMFRLIRQTGTESVYATDEDFLTEILSSCRMNCRTASKKDLPNLDDYTGLPARPEEFKDESGDNGSDQDTFPEREGRMIFFTSGTTSSSRAAVLTSRSVLASSWAGQCMLPCGPGDTILSLLPLSHVFGFVCSLLWGLTYGAAIALNRGTRYLLEDFNFFRPTIFPTVPSLLKVLFARSCLNSDLRVVLVGAAPLESDIVRAIQETGVQVYLGYGLTETSSGLAITQNQENPYALYPCPGADMRIEPDGEISVSTPCMLEGYLDFGSGSIAALESARSGHDGKDEIFHPSSALGHSIIPVSGGRLYTGDLGSIDESGALHLMGRKKDMLVLADGTKIFCPEYESALSALLGIEELTMILINNRLCVVIGGMPDKQMKEVEHKIEQFNEGKARGLQVSGILYFGRPLPKTPTGKIRRWEIEKACASGQI